MDELLHQLLNRLEDIGRGHEELYDTERRQQMSNAVFHGFLREQQDFSLPDDFGLHGVDANEEVKVAIAEYIDRAKAAATALGITTFHGRLAAFQSLNVRSDRERSFYDDFFGYSTPESFDEEGKGRSKD